MTGEFLVLEEVLLWKCMSSVFGSSKTITLSAAQLQALLATKQCERREKGEIDRGLLRKETLFSVLNFQRRKRNASIVIGYRKPCSQPSAEVKLKKADRA